MKRCACIDLGTNSILLLIAEARQGKLEPIEEIFFTTRLGEGMATHNRILPASVERTFRVLEQFQQRIQQEGVQRVICFGTQIFRRAENGPRVLEQIQAQFGWPVRLLSGEEEARLSYLGARDSLPEQWASAPVACIDIGGGSTELVLADGPEIRQLYSLPLGGVQLKETFQLPAQLTPELEARVRQFIREQWPEAPPSWHPEHLLAVGGTITTLVALEKKMTRYNFREVDGALLSEALVLKLYRKLNRLDLAARRALPGMEPGREDIILPAILILHEFMRHFRFTQLVASARGVRYGLLLEEPQCRP